MKRYLFKCILVLTFISLYSQSLGAYEFRIANLPDSLKEGAVSVVREYTANFVQTDINSGVWKVRRVITVLNDKGTRHADFASYKDKFVNFTKFEGVIRDNNGKEIKKIKRGDLTESTISEHMATDGATFYYEVKSPTYPFTVEYEYEQQFKNGIISYPAFYPTGKSEQSVEKASYTIKVPADIDLRYHSNFDFVKEESKTSIDKTYHFSSRSMKAIKGEVFSPVAEDFLPQVLLAPSKFCFDKVCGDMSTWKDFGLWQKTLLEGRDELPPAFAQKVKDMVKDAKTDRGKVDILYKYMQNNSRYVSIQLGIGGWQPIAAETTVKNNFGDCKGLSNLMMAMLKEVGISSNYTVIYMGAKKTLLKDFSSLNQTNHVILQVPLAQDTIWLECTSQTLPTGYVHDDIAGHDAFVITKEGGVICQLPTYASSENLTTSHLSLHISDDGKVSGEAMFKEQGLKFGDYYYMMKSNDRVPHVKYLNGSINMPQIKVDNITTSEDMAGVPTCIMKANFSASDYINISGQRMFIPISPVKKSGYNVFRSNTRNYDMVINDGFSEMDSIVFNLPQGYEIESLPPPIVLTTPFGIFTATAVKKSDVEVIYEQYIHVFAGRYDKSRYDEFRDFYKKIHNGLNRKLVIKKTENG